MGLLRTLCEAERWDDALRLYQELPSEAYLSGRPLTRYLARIRAGRGQYEEVLRMVDCEEVDADLILIPAVEAALRLGRQRRAERLAAQALQTKGIGAGLACGAVAEAGGRLEEALAWYEWEASRPLSSRLDRPMRAAGRVLMALGDYEEARIVLEHAVRRSHFLHREDVLGLAECLRREGKECLARRIEADLSRCPAPPPGPAVTPETPEPEAGSVRRSQPPRQTRAAKRGPWRPRQAHAAHRPVRPPRRRRC